MISELEVSLVLREPTFSTFEAAIGAAPERTERVEAEWPALKQARILDFRMGRSVVELLLSDRRILRIFTFGDLVEWDFVPGERLAPTPRTYAEEVRLSCTANGVKYEKIWRPDSLLRQRMGVTGVMLCASPASVILEMRGLDDLWFMQMDAPDGSRLLGTFEETSIEQALVERARRMGLCS